MQQINLAAVDLNLLVALRALLEERSVTRAAKLVGITQPAMSHALARLRDLFEDQLLVRGGKEMVLTPRAEVLTEPLGQLLKGAEALIGGDSFDPTTARGMFRLAANDYLTQVVLPPVVAGLRREAPNIDVTVDHFRPESRSLLETDALDLVIHPLADGPAGLRRQVLFEDSFQCVVRKGHPVLKGKGTLDEYVNQPHALVTVTGGTGHVDDALAKKGKRRRIALRIPHFCAAPRIVAATDLVLTLPRILAAEMVRSSDLVVMDPPLDLPKFSVYQVWHERQDKNPAHKWLRSLVAKETQGLNSE